MADPDLTVEVTELRSLVSTLERDAHTSLFDVARQRARDATQEQLAGAVTQLQPAGNCGSQAAAQTRTVRLAPPRRSVREGQVYMDQDRTYWRVAALTDSSEFPGLTIVRLEYGSSLAALHNVHVVVRAELDALMREKSLIEIASNEG